jgi:hypothetical protein
MESNGSLTLKELIDTLTEIYKQHGNLDVEINTHDGDLYELWSTDEIEINKRSNGEKFVEIGVDY